MNLSDLQGAELSAKIQMANAVIEKREESRILMKLLLQTLGLTLQDQSNSVFERLIEIENEFQEASEMLREIVRAEAAEMQKMKKTD